jgi:murein DD-endopeptidase MepM/ murein hydrolase activator NlpD
MIDQMDLQSFTKSFKTYLDNQKEYIDYLRSRPRFFISVHHVQKKLVVVKSPPIEEKKEEDEEDRKRRKKRKKDRVKQPVKEPVKQPATEAPVSEPVKEPVKQPVATPVTPLIPKPVVSKPEETPAEVPTEVPVEVPAKPPVKVPTPLEKPKQPQYLPPGVEFDPARPHLQPHPSSRMTGTDWVGDLATLILAGAAVFGLPALLGGGATTAAGAPAASGAVSGASKIVPFARQVAPAANKIVEFTRAVKPVPFAFGGAGYGPTYSLAGERMTELALPFTKIGEFANAIYREAGSLLGGLTFAMSKKLPRNSGVLQVLQKTRTLFGIDTSFTSELPGFPSKPPSLIVEEDSILKKTLSSVTNFVGNVFATGLSAILGGRAAKADPSMSVEDPQQLAPQTPVVVPEADPNLAGAEVTAKGLTGGNKISGYEINSHYGPRTHPVTGEVGKLHGGIDIGTPTGTAVALNVPGEIVFANPHSGYGYVIDAWVPSLNAQFRLAHLSKFAKKSGTFKAGEILAETGGDPAHPGAGSSTGPHLHYEIDTVKGGTEYGGARNRDLLYSLSKHLLLGTSSKPSGSGAGGRDLLIKREKNVKDYTTGFKFDRSVYSKAMTNEDKKLFAAGGGNAAMVKKGHTIEQVIAQGRQNLANLEKSKKLEKTKVNSTVPIPIQGPPTYTSNIITRMRRKRRKRTVVISPISKGISA